MVKKEDEEMKEIPANYSNTSEKDNEKEKVHKFEQSVYEITEIGPLQLYGVPLVLLLHIVSSFFALAFPFFELVPQLECKAKSGEWVSCSRKEVCSTGGDYRIDWSSKLSVVNIITEMDLVCEEDYKIGLLGSLVFLGFMLSSLTIMPFADIFGRKPILIVTAVVSTGASFMILFVRDMYYLYILLFMFGMTVLVRGTTSYVYVMEMVPESAQQTYVMILSCLEKLQVCMIPLCFYYTQDWKYNVSIYFCVSSLCTVFLLWLPESPKFLHQKALAKHRETQNERVLRNSEK